MNQSNKSDKFDEILKSVIGTTKKDKGGTLDKGSEKPKEVKRIPTNHSLKQLVQGFFALFLKQLQILNEYEKSADIAEAKILIKGKRDFLRKAEIISLGVFAQRRRKHQ